MGMKFKEINTLSFIGSFGAGKEKPVWKEIDEEDDIIHCRERFDRTCLHIKPLAVLSADLPGDGETKQLAVLLNNEVRIELMVTRAPSMEPNPAVKGHHEVQIQVQNKRTTRTPQGDFELDEGDLLVIPPDTGRQNFGHGATTRLIIYTQKRLHVAKGYPLQESGAKDTAGLRKTAGGCIFLRPKEVLELVNEGPSGGKHFELIENEDIMIETTVRSDSQRIYHRGFGQDEVAFQLSGRRATRTNQGEFMLETGDMLWIPPGASHRNIGDMLTVRIVMYTRNPLRISDEYNQRIKRQRR